MNNKREMNFIEKMKYLFCSFKNDSAKNMAIVMYVASLIFFIFCKYKIFIFSAETMPFCYFCIAFGTLFLFISLSKLLISYLIVTIKKCDIVDGHIFKTHVFRTNLSGGDYNVKSKAKAISEDKNITTDWQYYPHKFFKINDRPVKIIMNGNKPIKFYY